MEFSLAEHMTFKKLIRCALPCIAMMVSISVYSVVDGFFVSNFAGKTAFAAVNLIWPVAMVLATLGFVMGSGGAALVAKKFGEGKDEEGNRCFSNSVMFSTLLGIVTSVIVFFFLPEISRLLGADEEMVPHCVSYGQILILGVTSFNLQNLFQSFFTAAEKPRLGFIITLLAGVANIVLDAILVPLLGVVGAAIGTVAGQLVGAFIPIVYFARENPSRLRLRFYAFRWKDIAKMAGNGSSEFATNVSASVVSMLLNAALMRYYGQNGVGAYGTICYVWMIFGACFIGYNIAVGPRISYALGAGNKEELRSLYLNSLMVITGFGLLQFALGEALAVPISYAFCGYDEGLRQLTAHASFIYSTTYLVIGFSMFGSCFFTSLNNGLVSFLLSVVRLGGIQVACVLLLPLAFGGEAIWWSVPLGDFLGMIMNLVVMGCFAKHYGYNKQKTSEIKGDIEEKDGNPVL